MPRYSKDSPMGMLFKFKKSSSGGYVMLREPNSECPQDLKKIVIPDDVVEIGDNCFKGLKEVKTIIIPNSVRTIGNSCFAECSKLSSITIPDSVTSIGEYCFNRCISLYSVDIGSGLKVLPKESFRGTGIYRVSIPSNVKEVYELCFACCFSLNCVEFTGLESLSDGVFLGCHELRTIGFNEGIIHIGDLSGVNSHYFKSLYVPDSVTSFNWDLKFLDVLSVPSQLRSVANFLKGTSVKVVVR